MRFTFLGTGTSAGVPAIGCSCAVCTSVDPRDQRLRTSAALRFTDAGGVERAVLLDAGPDLRQQALRFGLTRLDAILFTHNHVDHTFGLDEVRRFNAVQREPIDIYAEEHTLAFLRRVYAHIFDKDRNVNDSFVATLIAHRIEPGRALTLHGVRFTPIRLLHGRLPVLGFRIERAGSGASGALESRDSARTPHPGRAPDAESEDAREQHDKAHAQQTHAARTPTHASHRTPEESRDIFPLAYCTDVSAIPPESYVALAGVRTLVLDALRKRHHPTHFTLEQAVRVADQVGADQTYFVHMAHELGHAETQAELPKGMHLAWDGLELGGNNASE